jgi:hypothetical protein
MNAYITFAISFDGSLMFAPCYDLRDQLGERILATYAVASAVEERV